MAGKWFCFISTLMPNDPCTSAHLRCDCNVILVNLSRSGLSLATAMPQPSTAPALLWLSHSQGQVRVQGPAMQSGGEKKGKTQLFIKLLSLSCANTLFKNPICATHSPPAPPLNHHSCISLARHGCGPGGYCKRYFAMQRGSTHF